MKNEAEKALEAGGVKLSDTPDFLIAEGPAAEPAPQVEAPAPEPVAAPEPQENITVESNEQPVQPLVEEQPAPEVVQESPSEPAEVAPIETEETGSYRYQMPDEDRVAPKLPNRPSPEELEGLMLNAVSERLNMKFDSFDDLQNMVNKQPEVEIDERIKAISDFVKETGRDPKDWFAYQQYNPSEMDDLTAVKANLRVKNPSLSESELDLFAKSKYKLDEAEYSKEEVAVDSLQLKMDAEAARKELEQVRERFKTPEVTSQPQTEDNYDSIVDDQWIARMSAEVDSLDGLEFELPNGKNFTFGINEAYKGQLKEKNSNLEAYFDSYVDDSGNWDYDLLNSHRTLIDNIDSIVQAVYNQGMSDGRRNVVSQAANVSAPQPVQTPTQTDNRAAIAEQVANAIGTEMMTFKF